MVDRLAPTRSALAGARIGAVAPTRDQWKIRRRRALSIQSTQSAGPLTSLVA